ncbi:multidrug effflux MFS transporter [Dactylosporangium sp. CA-233914]|uniref:multidrug effflux MFS transporter n=1 Tax=Dactylosporangium sp. CA-233914 TaxID=3239934 RepID=UPI003D8EC83C
MFALSLLAVLGPMTTDLYLPAFPRIAADLHASPAEIQWSLSVTLVGVAVGQLLFGPISDSVGRRRPLLCAAMIHVAASAAIAVTSSVAGLLVWRLLQGLGAAGVSVLTLAIARDLFEGRRLVRVLAHLGLLSGLAPVAAPVLGSLLLNALDWRGVFLVLAGYGLLAMAGYAAALPETATGAGARPAAVKDRYRAVVTDRALLGAAVIGATMAAGVFAYVSASSFVYQGTFGFSANVYALVFAVNAAAFALGSPAAAWALKRLSPQVLLRWALGAAFVAAVVLTTSAVLHAGAVGLTFAFFGFLLAAGICMPTIQIVALEQHAMQSGTAASIFGFINFGFASIISPLSGVGGDRILTLGVLLAALGCAATLSLELLVRPELKGRAHAAAGGPSPSLEGHERV